MSQADNFSDEELATVIAAAAYAIASLEEKEGLRKRRRSVEISGASLPKTKSRNEDTKIKLTSFHGSFKRWFTHQETKEDEKAGGENLTGNSASAEQMNLEESSTKHNVIEEPMDSIPAVTKTPTPTDKTLNETGGKRVESGKETRPGLPKASSTTKFLTASFGNGQQNEYSKEQSKAEAEAGAWEKEEMIKIRNRYDRMMSMIIEWENEKKEKARSRFERKQNEPESVRARALQKYEDEIARIEKVAGEARALAEERRRNDETKARAKAAKIRSTGRVPSTCCCC